MSLYKALTEANIPTDNHESDLYFPATTEARAILKAHGTASQRSSARPFTNQREGGTWLEVPFAFEPFWDKKPR